MVDRIRIWVCKDLQQCLEDLRREVAKTMKKKYNLKEVEVPLTLSSQILSARMRGQKFLDFKVRKVGLNKGVLEL